MGEITKLITGAASVNSIVAAISPRGDSYAIQQQNELSALKEQERSIEVSITTRGGPNGPPRDIYRVGQRVPDSITMTNTSDQPIEVCVSGFHVLKLRRDRPFIAE